MDKLFVIGNPISHSKSPLIHNYWIKKYSLNAIYRKKELNESDLAETINKVREGSIKGLNVTVPFKKNLLDFVDIIDETAKKSKAINTIFKEKGKIIGANTDGIGFVESLKKDLNVKLKEGSEIFCIGSGGAAYGIISELIKLKPNKIKICNRTYSSAVKLRNHFSNQDKIMFELKPWGSQPDKNTNLLVNTSTYGMKKEDKQAFNLDLLTKKTFVYDIIYDPKKTLLIEDALSRGLYNSNGTLMLIRQAAESFRRWFQIKLSNQDILEVKKLLKDYD